jgi:hypothetical protein
VGAHHPQDGCRPATYRTDVSPLLRVTFPCATSHRGGGNLHIGPSE